jgi:hypothetical protein
MSQIQQDIQRQQIAARTAALGNAIERATQQTSNSFASIVTDAGALRQDVVNSAYHDEADVAYIDAQIAGLASVVQTTATNLLALLPSNP